MLFGITAYAISLCTAGISAVNIFFDDAGSVVLFPSEMYFLVILNNSNISSNASIPVVP